MKYNPPYRIEVDYDSRYGDTTYGIYDKQNAFLIRTPVEEHAKLIVAALNKASK